VLIWFIMCMVLVRVCFCWWVLMSLLMVLKLVLLVSSRLWLLFVRFFCGGILLKFLCIRFVVWLIRLFYLVMSLLLVCCMNFD